MKNPLNNSRATNNSKGFNSKTFYKDFAVCTVKQSRVNELLEKANVSFDTNQRLIREVANF